LDCAHQRPSWGGEVAGARGSGLEGSLRCWRMAWAVVERRTTATTRRVPPQRGQVRTSARNVRLRSSAQGMGAGAVGRAAAWMNIVRFKLSGPTSGKLEISWDGRTEWQTLTNVGWPMPSPERCRT
jgi:hypothetical protein